MPKSLFLRLLDAVRPVQYAKLFGVPGQAQAGIDAYARLPLELTDSSTVAGTTSPSSRGG